MINLLIELVFRFIAYVMFGFSLEILFTAISKIADGDIRGRDKYLEGSTYLWMIPIYGMLLLLVFESVFKLITNFPIYLRFIIWSLSFTFFEALSGWWYDKHLGFCPWDYSNSKWKVFEKGYTKWSLLPAWGIAGLIIELHYKYMA